VTPRNETERHIGTVLYETTLYATKRNARHSTLLPDTSVRYGTARNHTLHYETARDFAALCGTVRGVTQQNALSVRHATRRNATLRNVTVLYDTPAQSYPRTNCGRPGVGAGMPGQARSRSRSSCIACARRWVMRRTCCASSTCGLVSSTRRMSSTSVLARAK
jgi:hypothetical protein